MSFQKNCSVGSVAEHLPSKQKVVGSSPTRSSLGDIAQLVERCLSKAKAGGSTPLIPTVVGPDIKMAPQSIGFVGSVVEHLPCKQLVVGSSPARSFESDEDSRRDCPLAQSVERETFKFEPIRGVS